MAPDKDFLTSRNGILLFVFCLMFFLFSCRDDDPQSAECRGGSLHMTLNGTHVMASTFENTLLKGAGAGKRMDIRATDGQGRQLIISFTDLSGSGGDCVSTDAYIPVDDVTTGTENTFLFTIIDGSVSEIFTDGQFDITDCDAAAGKVSGTFSFSFGDTEVTDGVFTDVCYSIL